MGRVLWGKRALFSRDGPQPWSAPQASQMEAQGLGFRGLLSGGTLRCDLAQGLPQTGRDSAG